MAERRPDRQPVDLEAAMLDPTTVFDDPADVIADPALTEAQKATVLERWRLEAERIARHGDVRPDAQAEAWTHVERAEKALARLTGGGSRDR